MCLTLTTQIRHTSHPMEEPMTDPIDARRREITAKERTPVIPPVTPTTQTHSSESEPRKVHTCEPAPNYPWGLAGHD